MKLNLFSKLLIIGLSCLITFCTLNEILEPNNTLKLYTNINTQLVIDTRDLIGETLELVEFESDRGCSTNCDVDVKRVLITEDNYVVLYDINRFHAIRINGQIINCLIEANEN